jgi:hypothetical protein
MQAILRYSGMALAAWAALSIASSPAAAAGFETKKLGVLISANERRGETSEWTYAWALDGQWERKGQQHVVAIALDSDYGRSDTSTTDRLLTSLRLIGNRDIKTSRWRPVMLAQTEGDHSFESALLLLALGVRQDYRYGFIEFTGGASRDIGGADDWSGDVGLAFAYARNLSERWKVRTGPKAQYGTLGELRLRDDRLRYSWDLNLDYQIHEKCSLGYRLWVGNTVPGTERTQWVGVNFKVK